MSTTTGDVALEDINRIVQGQWRFQRRWQLLSMIFYVVSTVGMLVSTSAAGLLAAMHYDRAAAILAAVSTVLIGLEKSLLFREKWKFHLTMRTHLDVLQTEIVTKGLDAPAAGQRLGEIMESYAVNLPVEVRGQ